MISLKNSHRIIILGNCGTGKSTLAARLGKILNISVIHLDKLYFDPDWKEKDLSIFINSLEAEMNKVPEWIIDGNYTRTIKLRAEKADTIILLKFPLLISYFRILKRRIMYNKRSRPDVADGCIENLNWELLKWMWNYKKRSAGKTEALIQRYKETKNIIILDSLKKVKLFVQSLS